MIYQDAGSPDAHSVFARLGVSQGIALLRFLKTIALVVFFCSSSTLTSHRISLIYDTDAGDVPHLTISS